MEVRAWSGCPPAGSGGVGRPSRRYGRCREAHPEVWEGSAGIGRSTQRFRRGLKMHLEVREGR